jgi:uncharacterized protein YbbK (DUF523 family)
MALSELPLVGVSACLLGQKVRYDGDHKYTPLIAEELKNYCRLVAVCPEMEIGLGVPRAKIQLTKVGPDIKVIKIDEIGLEVTDLLIAFATQFINRYPLSGIILQDRSPSCGVDNVKLFSQKGEQIGFNSGIFATTVMGLMPNIEVIQVSQLQNMRDIEHYIKKLY